MAQPLVRINSGAFDVVAFDGRLRVVRRRDGAIVGDLPLVDEPTFGSALKEAVERFATPNPAPEPAANAASTAPNPKKKRRSKRSPPTAASPEPTEPRREELETKDLNDGET